MNDLVENLKLNYVEYAEDMINRYSQHREMIKNGNLDIFEINKALADYKAVNDFLVFEYEKKVLEYELKQSEFDDWYSDKYCIIRERLNPTSLSAQKWASTKEIGMYVRKEYKEEYKEKNDILIVLGREVSTLRRLCDSFKRMDGIFQTLSANYRHSENVYSLTNRMNSPYKVESEIRKRRGE